MYPEAIYPVGKHVKQQSHTNDPRDTLEKKEQNINFHRPISMKKMKVDTATVCRENRRTEQVICVYQHRPEENEVRFFPILPKKDIGNNHRKKQMKEIM